VAPIPDLPALAPERGGLSKRALSRISTFSNRSSVSGQPAARDPPIPGLAEAPSNQIFAVTTSRPVLDTARRRRKPPHRCPSLPMLTPGKAIHRSRLSRGVEQQRVALDYGISLHNHGQKPISDPASRSLCNRRMLRRDPSAPPQKGRAAGGRYSVRRCALTSTAVGGFHKSAAARQFSSPKDKAP
jgi:hypothetical protein